MNDTCVVPKESSYWCTVYSDFTIPANSGTYSIIFEAKYQSDAYILVGAGLAQKVKTMDQKYFDEWVL